MIDGTPNSAKQAGGLLGLGIMKFSGRAVVAMAFSITWMVQMYILSQLGDSEVNEALAETLTIAGKTLSVYTVAMYMLLAWASVPVLIGITAVVYWRWYK